MYGEFTGVRTARKHIGWAVRALPGGEDFRRRMNALERCEDQVRALTDWLDALADAHERLPYLPVADDAANDEQHQDEDQERRLTA
jgi:tRNA-dihydrouridine synthase B